MNLKNNMNKKYTLIAGYVIVTAFIIYCLGLVALNAPEIFKVIVSKASWLLKVAKPIVLGFAFAYLVEPLVTFFDEKYKKIKIFRKKQSSCRTYAVITTLIIVGLVFVTIISLLVSSVTSQLRVANFDDIVILFNTYIKSFSDFCKMLINKLNELNVESAELQRFVKEASAYATGILASLASNAMISLSNISGFFTTAFFALIIGIYFLIDGKMIKTYVSKVSMAVCNKKFHNGMKKLAAQADQVFSGYIRGQLMDATVMMVIISISLSLIGVKFGVLIGVLAGIGNLIPYCGPIVAYAGTIVVCLLNGQYKQLIVGIVVLFIIQTIDGNIIGPKLLSQSIQIHPLLVIISLIFGSAVGGFLGMLLAVPVGAFLKVLFVQFIDSRLEAKLEKEEHT